MAAETPVIQIKTLEAVKNVKDLKDNISALKSKIDDVNTSTEDYADLTRQLSQNQAALRNVMNGTNSTFDKAIQAAQGLDSSYNSLVQQLKEATQEWRTIPKYLSDADKAQGVINQAWTDATKKVEELRSELKSMDAATGNFTRNVGNYKSALDGFSGAMGQIKQVGGDMVNGISALSSSMAMLGYSTDGLDDSMKNLRIVLAAVQGAKGFAGLIKNLGSYFKAGKQAVTVTKQQATATQAQAAAQTAANVATEAGTKALSGLQKALIATGIGALVVALGMLVAHFEEIVQWVGKIGEKFGLWSAQTDRAKEANEQLKTSIEKQNRAFDNQAKILSAQGVSNKQILLQKKELIKSQINETKAAITAAEARIKQLEADHKWWKFWQGTKGKVAKELENIEEWNKSLKDLTDDLEDINVDIRVETIKEGQKAAEDAANAAAQAVELAQNVVNKGVEEATKIMQSQETELQKIEREHKTNVDLINSAITATKELTGVTEEQRKILSDGLVKEGERYTKALQDYYKNEYEKKAAEEAEQIVRQKNAEYAYAERTQEVEKNVLATTKLRTKAINEATASSMKEYDILKEQIEAIKKDIRAEAKGPVAMALLPDIRTMTDSQIREKYSEPLATKLISLFETEDKLRKAGDVVSREILEGYEAAIQEAVDSGQFGIAETLWKNLSQTVRQMFGNDKLNGIGGAAIEYVQNINKAIEEAQAEYPLPKNWIWYDIFEGFDKNGTKMLASIREQMQELRSEGKEASDEFVSLSEQATALSMKLWDDYFKKIGKHFNTYGRATTNVMDAVADCWEAALQAQVKNGKKSEEEAKKSFENVKKLQMASAIINTGAAIVQALADPTVPSYYVKVANAAAAAIAGAAQVIKIANTDFSSSAGSATDSTPKLVDRTPQLQYTVGLNPQDYAAANAEQPIRAYIVDRDLAEGMDEYNKRQNETTF